MNPPPRRVRLKPWLVAQVSSQRYPGLRWLDPERRRFVIPWCHATRNPPAPPEHDTIFKAWAQVTGRLGTGAAPARWKATLRCALHKSREFRLLLDGPPRAAPRGPSACTSCARSPAADDCDSGEEEEEEEEEMSQLQKLTALSIDDTQPGGDLLPPWTEEEEEPPFSGCAPGPLAPAPPPLLPEEVGGTQGPPELPPARLAEGGAPLGTLGPPTACPLAPTGHDIPNLLISPHMLPLTDLELEFRYRGRQVSAVTISHPHGCRLFHSRLRPTRERVELFGPLALEQVPFPPPDAIPNQKQRFYTQQLLEVLDRGAPPGAAGAGSLRPSPLPVQSFLDGALRPPPGPAPTPSRGRRGRSSSASRGFSMASSCSRRGRAPPPPPSRSSSASARSGRTRSPRRKNSSWCRWCRWRRGCCWRFSRASCRGRPTASRCRSPRPTSRTRWWNSSRSFTSSGTTSSGCRRRNRSSSPLTGAPGCCHPPDLREANPPGERDPLEPSLPRVAPARGTRWSE
ncbi:unnamed protein product [Bubo scandiacus]